MPAGSELVRPASSLRIGACTLVSLLLIENPADVWPTSRVTHERLGTRGVQS